MILFIDTYYEYGKSSESIWIKLLPLLGVVIGGYLTYFFTNSIRRKDTKINMVYTCDKLIRLAVKSEQSQITYRLYEYLFSITDELSFEKEKERFRELSITSIEEYKSSHAELIKYTYEIYKFNKSLAKKISQFVNRSNQYKLRAFENEFQLLGTNQVTIEKHYRETHDNVYKHILYNSAGIYYSKIMDLFNLKIQSVGETNQNNNI